MIPEKRRRRVAPGNKFNILSEQEQNLLLEEAFDRLACVNQRQFEKWADGLWETPRYPTDVEDILFSFCGECTSEYETSQRAIGQCNRDEWDLIGLKFDIEEMRELD